MNAFDVACARPWLLTEEALHTILTIAARENPSIEAVEARLGRPLDNSHTVTVREGVATIPVQGPIFRYANLFAKVSGATSTEELAQDLQTALDDPSVTAICLNIDSPGGEAAGIAELAAAIYAARDRKPIAAYIGADGCSAAYWLAAAAGEVVAASTAVVGSIGAVVAIPDPSGRSASRIEFVSSQSPDKRVDPTTERGRAKYQAQVDALAGVFVADVARYRGVSEEAVLADFGQGGVFIGQAAVDAGLVDRLGSYEGTIADLAARARPRMTTPGMMPARLHMEGNRMDWKSVFAGLFSAAKEAEAADEPATIAASAAPVTPAPVTLPLMTAGPDPEVEALRAKLAALEAEREAERASALADKAAAFADALVGKSIALPAERDALMALFTQAMTDDRLAGAENVRVAQLAALFAARTPHALTEELVETPLPEGSRVIENRVETPRAGADKPMTEAEREEYLSKTATGRAVLEAERKQRQG